jgi:hypothetical protein
VSKRLPEGDLLLKKTGVVMMPGMLDGGTGRREGLDDYLPLGLTATSTTRNLSQELKSPFPSPEIGRVKPYVGIDNANKGDVRKIEPLGDHLGTQQNIDLTGPKLSQHFGIRTSTGHGVGIHPRKTCLWKKSPDCLFDPLGADAGMLNAWILAFRTALRRLCSMAAEMTGKAVIRAMQG